MPAVSRPGRAMSSVFAIKIETGAMVGAATDTEHREHPAGS
jgi:hypothetical protein